MHTQSYTPSVASSVEDSPANRSPFWSPAIGSTPSSPGYSPENSVFEDAAFFALDESKRNFLRNNSKQVMVVGGLGYIGSHTTLELLKEGYNVIVVDDLSNSFENVLDNIRHLATEWCTKQGLHTPLLKLHQFDYRSQWMRHLLSRYALRQTEAGAEPASRIAGVIHFAAFKSVEESISKPLQYYQNNICGLVDLLCLLQEFGIKNFVFSSSATVYGTRANAGKPLKEHDLVHFPETLTSESGEQEELVPGATGLTSPYGRTKYFAEAILADVARSDPTMRITALRYFNPVGCHPSGILREDPRQKPTNLFPVIAQVLTGARPILDVFGSDWETRDGTAVRDFIHVSDLARGHIAAMAAASSEKNTQAFRSYNLGTGNGTTVAEVVDYFEKASGVKLPVNMTHRRPGDVGFCVAATQRATEELGWKTELSMETCARDCWNALQMANKAQSTGLGITMEQ
ncbi:Bifunctional protein GAL10 [Sphaceloma murrayae]|uniref:Bifunctional protein GAL10 n=1 Tax=Sphaceloma murrayae TaxID=2082308 RepID=A0A2K1QUZ7_9PEZI|nr:Bifunctional protein GAL10 [Sphaceloma murrayae]